MSILSMFRNTRLVMGLAGILMWLAASSRGGAQDIPTYRLDTGFFTFTAGEQVRISVAELGTSTVGKVRVSILDEAERAIVPPRTLAFRRGAPAKFDLTLNVGEVAGGLSGQWLYNAELYDGAEVTIDGEPVKGDD